MQSVEPVFLQQEQAIVYLFSRYWERLPQFKGKKILRIHTHFPDFSLAAANGDQEAIEFEYRLSAFSSHLKTDCLTKLQNENVRVLHIVYWEENEDRASISGKIRECGFKGGISYTCLKNHFKAAVDRPFREEPLRTGWRFETTQNEPAYQFEQILKSVNNLEIRGTIKRFDIKQGLYRTTSFNRSEADFIEAEHWSHIHFYPTTTPFGSDNIPEKLLVRPSGCKHFYGFFEIKAAFKIRAVAPEVKNFFREFYFFDYEPYQEIYDRSTCFIYSKFDAIEEGRGSRLFHYLKEKGYKVDERGSKLIDYQHNSQVDRMLLK